MNFANNGLATASKRLWGVGVVVVLHLLLAWGLMHGLARKASAPPPDIMETRIIQDLAAPAEAAPAPMPEFTPPPPYIPLPDIVIQPPPVVPAPPAPVAAPAPPADRTADVAADVAAEVLVTVPPPRAVQRVAPRIDLKGSPRACREPAYPAASERRGEQGLSAISLLIDEQGRVAQARIDSSSGHARLDEAAIQAFSRCKFSVGTVDGVPEASWFSIRYKWVIQTR